MALDEVDAVNMENRINAVEGTPLRTTYGGLEIPSELLERED